jgi:hypothetical protein
MGGLTDAKMSYQTESFRISERASSRTRKAASMKSHELPETYSLQLEASISYSENVENLITF